MALTKSRNRMTAGAVPAVIDFNSYAGDGSTDARSALVSATAGGSCRLTAGTYRVASNVTLSGVLHIEPGAMLKPATGVTITIAGLILADRHKIFDTSLGGFIVSTPGTAPTPVTTAYPEWWGATGLAGDQSPYIQAAIDFIQLKAGGTVRLNGWYSCQTVLLVSGRVRIEGQGPVWSNNVGDIERSTALDFSTAPSGIGAFLVQNGASYVNGFQLVNVGVFRNPPDPAAAHSVGLHLVAPKHYRIEGCSIFGFSCAMQTDDNSGADAEGHDGVVDNCILGGATDHTLIIGGIAGLTFRDCTISAAEPGMSSVVQVGRGFNGKAADTLSFVDSRILFLSTVASITSIVSITDGMWISFERTDIEGPAQDGILVQRDATAGHHDLGLVTFNVSNCWFNASNQAISVSGYRANGRIIDCRMENDAGGALDTVIELSLSTLLETDISIRGNNIRSSGNAAVTVTNAKGVRISENYIYGDGFGVALPGIILTATAANCIVTANRVAGITHLTPINDGGAGNVVANNIIVV